MHEESLEKVLKLRWLVLVMMGLVVFGVYYAYDSVVPVADYIISELGVTRAQYGLLFSYYSLPNLLMVLLGGILLGTTVPPAFAACPSYSRRRDF